MSYQEERKFITYLTNINLRALLMSDGIINDLRGSVEQHSQKTPSPSVIPHQPNSYMLLDLQRVSQAARRRYGAEGNTGKYGIYNLDLSWLLFCLSLKCHSSWSCIVLYFCDFSFFFPREIKFTNFELHPPWCWASHLQPHVRSWSFWGFNSCAAGLGGCLEQVRPPCAAVRRNVVVKVKLFMVGLQ